LVRRDKGLPVERHAVPRLHRVEVKILERFEVVIHSSNVANPM